MRTLILPTIALFARAMRDEMRSKYPVIVRIVAVLTLLLLISGMNLGRNSDPATGRTLLTMIAMVNFVGLTLYAIGSFPSAITEEKEDETLGLLRMTRLGPVSILLGKVGARLAGGLLFLSVQVPFTILCVALGGVGMPQILKVYLILAAFVFFLANLGLLCSVISRGTGRAVTMTLILGLLLYVLPFFVWFGRSTWSPAMAVTSPIEDVAGTLVAVNPLGELLYTLYGRVGFPIRGESIGFHLIGGIVCFALARALFENFCGADSAIITGKVKVIARTRSGFSRPWNLAIAWRDFHFQAGGLKGVVMRFAIYCVIFAGLLAWLKFTDVELTVRRTAETGSNCAILMFTVEFAIRASRMFGAERRARTLSGIYLLPTTAARIAWQKLFGNAVGLLPSIVIWLTTCAALRVSEPSFEFMAEWARRSGVHLVQRNGLLEWLRLSPWDVFAAADYVLFAILVIYLSLRMKRGALLMASLATLIVTIAVQFLYYKMRMPAYSIASSAVAFERFDRNFHLTAALIMALFATLIAASIPRRVAVCAAEE